MQNKTRRTNPGLKSRARTKTIKSQTKTKKLANSKKQIKSKEAYELVINEIDILMKKGENNLTKKELGRLRILAEAAELYEDTKEPLPIPNTLPEMISMRMFQMRINRGFTARLLGVSDAKFSMIMNGRQKPDVYFIKAVHDKLKVDAKLILQAI